MNRIIPYILLIILSGCIKDDLTKLNTEVEWTPELAFPIGETLVKFKNTPDFTNLPDGITDITLSRIDTFSFETKGVFDYRENITGVQIRIISENRFPFDALVKGYFGNNRDDLLFSFTEPNHMTLPAASIDKNGNITSSHEVVYDFTLSDEQIDLMWEGQMVTLNTTIEISESDSIALKNLSNYQLVSQAGIKANIIKYFK